MDKAGEQSAARDEVQICIDCSRVFGVWFVANEIWNRVITGRVGMLCCECFMARAEKSDLKVTGWQLVPENLREASTAEQSPEPPCPTCDSREKSKRFHPYVEACTHNNYRHRCADVKCVDSWHEVGSVGESPKEKL